MMGACYTLKVEFACTWDEKAVAVKNDVVELMKNIPGVHVYWNSIHRGNKVTEDMIEGAFSGL